jgi:predicted enzyme related to lactoylglutathione lyase
MNTIGFTHIAFNVPDVDKAARRIESLGGSVLEGRRIRVSVNAEGRDYAFVADPDGNRIELIRGTVLG